MYISCSKLVLDALAPLAALICGFGPSITRAIFCPADVRDLVSALAWYTRQRCAVLIRAALYRKRAVLVCVYFAPCLCGG